MCNTLLFFLTMSGLTSVVEYLVLRRWHGRWSFPACVVSVAAISAVIWLLSWMFIPWTNRAADIEPDDAFEWFSLGLMIVLFYFFFAVMALIPASVVAVFYRKRIRDLPE